jgi:polyisoprenoid-binding protein YceI
MQLKSRTMSRWKSNAAFRIEVAGFLLAASLGLVSADRAIDTDHSTLKIHVGKAGLFSPAGDDHWVNAPFAGGRVDDGDSAQVAFTVDARKLTLVEDNKLSEEQQAEVQHTMHAKVLQSEEYPLISFHSTKIEKAGVNRWVVAGELILHGQSRPILGEVHYGEGAYTGRSTIKQTDFGINPVTVGGGVVRVKNELEIQFVVVPIR